MSTASLPLVFESADVDDINTAAALTCSFLFLLGSKDEDDLLSKDAAGG